LEYRKGVPRQRTKNWDLPLKWNKAAAGLAQRPRVFPSMCDPFDAEVPWTWFCALMDLIIRTPHLDWLLLTKRPENAEAMGRRWAADRSLNWTGFPPNVWLGASAENQERADRRIPILLIIPAKIHFVSAEPYLGLIDFNRWIRWDHTKDEFGIKDTTVESDIDWVIFGGESGRRARPCNCEEMLISLDQCRQANIAVFMKQVGADPQFPLSQGSGFKPHDRKGGNPSEWPSSFRYREFPAAA